MPIEKNKTQGRRKKKQTENSTPSNYRDLPVARIRGNKWNPRSSGFDGPKFDELVASIRQRGVIQPIVVRSIQESDYDFEIIAGERRHRAMSLVASEDPAKGTIPAIIRECNDEDALEICFIENLQRQDLSELEEARAFAEYVDRKGLDGVIILAEKLGISPRYVRKRVGIMRLPRPLIWAWQKEIIQYGHLEQFLRIDGKKERLMMLKQIIGAWTGGEGIPTVRDFKHSIDEASADLGRALFDKKACSTCARNSETQRNLFGIGDDRARCLDSRCYLTKQKEWLGENWQSHLKEIDPELNTNGMRFADEVSYTDCEPFYYRHVPEECLACESFVTVINPSGNIRNPRACCGSKECRSKILNGRNTGGVSSGPAASSDKGLPGRDETESENGKPVKSWHGEFFREEFFKARIPEKAKELDPFHDKMVQLSLFAIVASNSNIHSWFSEKLALARKPKDNEYGFFLHCKDILAAIEGLGSDQIRTLLKEATIQVLLNPRTVLPQTRRTAAVRFLGIDLAGEWRITKDYLEKKTKSEIVSIINRFKILDLPQALKFAGESAGLKKKSSVGKLKKEQLMAIVMDSGIDLAGIVPAEILYESAAVHTSNDQAKTGPVVSQAGAKIEATEFPPSGNEADTQPAFEYSQHEPGEDSTGYTEDPEDPEEGDSTFLVA